VLLFVSWLHSVKSTSTVAQVSHFGQRFGSLLTVDVSHLLHSCLKLTLSLNLPFLPDRQSPSPLSIQFDLEINSAATYFKQLCWDSRCKSHYEIERLFIVLPE
jgi:hypothetical protein